MSSQPFREQYLRRVVEAHRTLQLFGIRADTPVEVDLEEIYVSLTLSIPREHLRWREGLRQHATDVEWMDEEESATDPMAPLCPEAGSIEAPLPSALKRRPLETLLSAGVSIPKTLQQTKRLVILGAPGSGKTTLLRYLALTYANRKAKERLELNEDLLPVFVRLRDLDASLSEDTCAARRVRDFLTAQSRLLEPELPSDFLSAALERGECVLLLDGLDEVPRLEHRARVAAALTAFVETYPANRCIITSRIQGYRGISRFAAGFVEGTLNEFSDEDVERFVTAWYQAVRGTLASPLERRRAEEMSADLRRAVTTYPKVRALARNPLLLSTIALVHYNRIRLPERRVELYDECTAFLLGYWDEVKGVQADEELRRAIGTPFEREAKRELLEPIALWFHQQGMQGFITDRATLHRVLMDGFQRLFGWADQERLARVAELFLQLICERAGLLVEREQDYFAFSHLTFQEYLAARHIAYRDDYIAFLKPRLHDSWWQEVVLLTVGHLGSGNNPVSRDRATRLVEAIRRAGSDYESLLHRDLLLAAQCLADVSPTGVFFPIRDAIRQDLLHIWHTTRYIRLRSAAAAALVALAREGSEADLVQTFRQKWDDLPAEEQAALLRLLASLPPVESGVLSLAFYASSYASRHLEVLYAVLDVLSAAVQRDEAALQRMLEAVHHDTSERVRGMAVWALGTVAGQEGAALPALLEAVHDASEVVRGVAVGALGTVAGQEGAALPALLEAVHDASADVRMTAVWALGTVAGQEGAALPALLEAVHDASADVRMTAVEALGAVAGQEGAALAALLEAVRDASEVMRGVAVRALGTVAGQEGAALPALLEAVHHDASADVRMTAVRALGTVAGQEGAALPALLEAVRDTSADVRGAAVEALAPMVGTDVIARQGVETSLHDRDWHIRVRAAAALAGVTGLEKRVLPVLFEAIKGPAEDRGDSEAKSRAAEGLGRLMRGAEREGTGMVQELAGLLRAPDPHCRATAASLLAQTGALEFASDLVSMLDDPQNDTLAQDYLRQREAPVYESIYEALWNLVYGTSGGIGNAPMREGVQLTV